MVCRAVHLDVEADFPKRALRRFRQKGKFHAPGVREPAHRELLAVLLADAIAVGIHPTGLLKQLFGCLWVVSCGLGPRGTSAHEPARERACGNSAAPIQQRFDEAFAVDAQAQRLAHRSILHHRRSIVHLAEERARGAAAANGVLAWIREQLVAGVRQAIRRIDLPRLKGGRKRVAVGDGSHHHLVHLGLAVPVVLVSHQRYLGIGNRGSNIGAGSAHVAVGGNARLHVDDGAVRVAQVVDQGGSGLAGGYHDAALFVVGLNRGYLGVGRRPIVRCHQIVQALLHRRGAHVPAGSEVHVVAQGDSAMRFIQELVGGCQPRLGRHVVAELEQGLAHPVADRAPARVVGMGVQAGVVHLHAVTRCAVDERFRSIVAAIGTGTQSQTEYRR